MFADQSPNGHPHGAGQRWHDEALSGSKRPSRDGQGGPGPNEGGTPSVSSLRRMAELRRALMEAVTPDDIRQVTEALLRKAESGNVQAIKLVLEYRIGKPAPQQETSGGLAETLEVLRSAFDSLRTLNEGLQGEDENLPE